MQFLKIYCVFGKWRPIGGNIKIQVFVLENTIFLLLILMQIYVLVDLNYWTGNYPHIPVFFGNLEKSGDQANCEK